MRYIFTLAGVIVVASLVVGHADAQGLGEKRWVKPGRSTVLCNAPRYGGDIANCFSINRGGFVVEGVAHNSRGGTSLQVKLDDGRVAFMYDHDFLAAESEGERSNKVSAKRECDRRGGAQLGMTRDQVYASCWGKPKRINKTVTASGIDEQLVYGAGYLYLTDGVLTSIQTAH